MKIAIVDDSGFSRNRAKSMLKKHFPSVEFVECVDGLEAVEKLPEQEGIDFVMLDMVMPNLDGFGVLRELGEIGYKRPVVVVTSDVQEGTVNKCKELGCFSFINKPLSPKKIADMVEELGL